MCILHTLKPMDASSSHICIPSLTTVVWAWHVTMATWTAYRSGMFNTKDEARSQIAVKAKQLNFSHFLFFYLLFWRITFLRSMFNKGMTSKLKLFRDVFRCERHFYINFSPPIVLFFFHWQKIYCNNNEFCDWCFTWRKICFLKLLLYVGVVILFYLLFMSIKYYI